MSYPGGKAAPGVYQRIINQIPPHATYIEAFLGDGAILRRKKPAARNIGIEIDAQTLAEHWSDADDQVARLPDDGIARFEIYHANALDWLEHHFQLNRYPAAATGDRSSFAETVVNADPPYLIETRKTPARIYRHEFTEADHVRFLELANRIPCPMLITHYPCPLYDDALSDWRQITYRIQTRAGAATERLYCNYEEPAELHDARFVGNDKRQRERLKRRRLTIQKALAGLPPLQRQHILDEIGA